MSRHDRPNRHIAQASEELQRAGKLYPSRWHTLSLLANPVTSPSYDGTTRSGISDPTPTQAFNLAQWHDLQMEIRAEAAEAAGPAARLVQLLNRIPSDLDTAAIARQQRCTGGEPSVEGWTRPECSELAVTRDGLCSACYQRRHHWRKAQPIEGAA
jgi:hypothetical protein